MQPRGQAQPPAPDDSSALRDTEEAQYVIQGFGLDAGALAQLSMIVSSSISQVGS